MAGCWWWVADDGDDERPDRPRSCTTRPPGPGPPPGTCSSLSCGFAGHAAARRQGARGRRRGSDRTTDTAPRCTTRPAGPGPPPGRWSAASMASTATLLRDGKVLVTGRRRRRPAVRPDSGTWTATGKMNDQRHSHAAILLPDGKVLVAGGHAPPATTARRTRPRCTTPSRGPGPRSRTCTRARGHRRPSCSPMARCWWSDRPRRSAVGRVYDPATGTWTALADADRVRPAQGTLTMLSDGSRADDRRGSDAAAACTAAGCTTRAPGRGRPPRACSGAATARSFTLLLDGTVLVAGGSDCNDDGVCVSTGAAELYVPAGVSLPPLPAFPSPPPPVFPSPTPSADAAPAGGRSRSAERAVLEGHGRQQELRARDAVRGRGGRERDVTARRVRDSERGPSRRHREGDLPLPCQDDDGWIYVNPRPGEGGSLVNADRHRHPRQDPDHGGRPSGLVEPVAGKHRAERLRRLACAGHALRVSRKSYRSRMAAGIAFVTPRCCHCGAPGRTRGHVSPSA